MSTSNFARSMLVAGSLWVLAAGCPNLNANPITFQFAGQLDDPFGSLPVGTPFSGSFSYDYPQAPLNIPGVFARYAYTDFTLTINSVTTSFPDFLTAYPSIGGSIRVFDDGAGFPTDMFELSVEQSMNPNSVSIGGLALWSMVLNLQDLTKTAFTDTSLPGPGMDFSDFTHTPGPGNPSFLQLTSVQPNFQFARGRLTSVSVSTVPETGATLSLLALAGGLLGLGLRGLRMT